jgi:hypothetical protein
MRSYLAWRVRIIRRQENWASWWCSETKSTLLRLKFCVSHIWDLVYSTSQMHTKHFKTAWASFTCTYIYAQLSGLKRLHHTATRKLSQFMVFRDKIYSFKTETCVSHIWNLVYSTSQMHPTYFKPPWSSLTCVYIYAQLSSLERPHHTATRKLSQLMVFWDKIYSCKTEILC